MGQYYIELYQINTNLVHTENASILSRLIETGVNFPSFAIHIIALPLDCTGLLAIPLKLQLLNFPVQLIGVLLCSHNPPIPPQHRQVRLPRRWLSRRRQRRYLFPGLGGGWAQCALQVEDLGVEFEELTRVGLVDVVEVVVLAGEVVTGDRLGELG